MRARVIILGLCLLALPTGPVTAGAPACPLEVQAALGYCPDVSNNGTSLDISGTQHQTGTDNNSNSDNSNDNSSDANGSPSNPRWNTPFERCQVTATAMTACPPEPVAPTPGQALPAVTIADLAQFAPAPVSTTAEPDNVGIAGMPTNFVATASAHTRTGTLFGFPIAVRFTPSGYDYHYGDGTSATLTSPGQTWASLGQAQFTPTATSHTYQQRGTYIADVDVRYTAEVDLGAGWFPVSGELTTDGPGQQIRIFEAHTALVAHTCAEKPTAPGC